MPQIWMLPPQGEPPSAFVCHHCGVHARHEWAVNVVVHTRRLGGVDLYPEVRVSRCDNCEQISLWHNDKLVSPEPTTAPAPNSDMPPQVQAIYNEASGVAARSPRSAAALLRLSIQLLCDQLAPNASNLNEAIGDLVRRGMPPRIQQALDVVRVTGNNAVHPGEIQVDDAGVVAPLFELVNLITETMISQPKQITEMYGALPEPARQAIERRDENG